MINNLQYNSGDNISKNKLKIVSLGKLGIGKTHLINRFIDTKTNDTLITKDSILTNKQSFRKDIYKEKTYLKDYYYKEDKYTLNIIDTPGQNEFTPSISNHLKIGVHGYLLVFSISDSNSFEIVQHANQIIINSMEAKYIPRVVVGINDTNHKVAITDSKIKEFCKLIKSPYIEYNISESYPTNYNIEKIFYKLIKEIRKQQKHKYPFNIKNASYMKSNFIIKNHNFFKLINKILMITNIIISVVSCIQCFVFITVFILNVIINNMFDKDKENSPKIDYFLFYYIIFYFAFTIINGLSNYRAYCNLKEKLDGFCISVTKYFSNRYR